ncbi:hypothetical protein GCM10020254_18350 [Streptomyces goshikiensis]
MLFLVPALLLFLSIPTLIVIGLLFGEDEPPKLSVGQCVRNAGSWQQQDLRIVDCGAAGGPVPGHQAAGRGRQLRPARPAGGHQVQRRRLDPELPDAAGQGLRRRTGAPPDTEGCPGARLLSRG